MDAARATHKEIQLPSDIELSVLEPAFIQQPATRGRTAPLGAPFPPPRAMAAEGQRLLPPRRSLP